MCMNPLKPNYKKLVLHWNFHIYASLLKLGSNELIKAFKTKVRPKSVGNLESFYKEYYDKVLVKTVMASHNEKLKQMYESIKENTGHVDFQDAISTNFEITTMTRLITENTMDDITVSLAINESSTIVVDPLPIANLLTTEPIYNPELDNLIKCVIHIILIKGT